MPLSDANKRQRIWNKQLKILQKKPHKTQWEIGFIDSVSTRLLAKMELTFGQSEWLARLTLGGDPLLVPYVKDDLDKMNERLDQFSHWGT